MNNNIPRSPADVVPISPSFKFSTNIALKFVTAFKCWKNPIRKAAAAYEEMSWLDKVYWFYKSNNPIERPEKKSTFSKNWNLDSSTVSLPKDFKKEKSVSVGAAGDLFYADNLSHSKDIFYENISDILFDQDISYANLEAPITENAPNSVAPVNKEAPLTCCSREQLQIINGHKDKFFTTLNTANNHILDFGIEGLENTHKTLTEHDITYLGTNDTKDEYFKAKVLTINGIKIGFPSVTFGLNGQTLPHNESYRVNLAKLSSKFIQPDLKLIKQHIDYCKKQDCDFIIATLHWGYEFEFFPRDEQIKAARELVEYGADAIICHHPHVIQPVEYYRSQRDPDRVAVIAYSLGTLAWTFNAPHLALSAILNLKLSKGTFNDKSITYLEGAKTTPVFRNYFEQNGKLVTRVEKLYEFTHSKETQLSPEYINDLKRYAKLVLGKYKNNKATTKKEKLAA